jgi:single-stranded-DNA-specific exonuclease
LPAERVPELRTHLDAYARARLTLADFEPRLSFDAELSLDQVTPELFQTLQRLQPFGVGNPQPVFTAHGVRLAAPPRILKDKHVKLKLGCDLDGPDIAILTTPRCDPDSSTLRRREVRELTDNRELTAGNWRKAVTFHALGWHMAERSQQAGLLVGDNLDIAFTIDNNDHPDYGGLELSLRDFKSEAKVVKSKDASVPSESRKGVSAVSP